MTEKNWNDISVEVTYLSDEIDIERQENLSETRVTIKDKKTGEILRTVGEITNLLRTNYNKTIYEEYDCGRGIKPRLYGDILMYFSGSFHEIVKATNIYWKEASSGGWKLKEKQSGWTKMAPNRFEVYGNAIVTVESTSEVSMGASFSMFEGLGFDMSGSSSSTWHARKIINGGFVYKI
ncbi:hypothetical protein [Velocimicrobium porci]|uniref:Uncharacterized protein n=1 Tax=Velocimicrobium porci TaxID=2606634 RepID=A0A6L5XV95_9FIRM|nr:hypothetical protein [Velocimicrobium porci]MSS62746.1 hypothetical protein [Velocimicrobium porci]